MAGAGWRRLGFVGCVALLGLTGAARGATPHEARAGLAQERQQLAATLAAREAACRQRFVVTGCVEQARREHRQALEPVRQRGLAIDAAERRQRTDERRRELAEKAGRRVANAPQGAASRSAPSPLQRGVPTGEGAAARAVPAPLVPRGRGSVHAAPSPLVGRAVPRQGTATTPAPRAGASAADDARLRVEQAQQREARTAVVRSRVERRVAERAAKGPPAVPLPVPAEPGPGR